MANRLSFKRKDVLHHIHEPWEHEAGIYRIWSPNLKMSYVGSSGQLTRRCKYHWNHIQKGKEECSSYFIEELLAGNLEFTILEYIESDEKLSGKARGPLLDREEHWAREYHAKGELLNSKLGLKWATEDRPTYTKEQLLSKLATARRSVERFAEDLASMGVFV